MNRPNIFDYLDYRAFLKDVFAFRKRQAAKFSYRFLSRRAGFKSPNFLKLVAEGQRNLGLESIAKVAKGLDLKRTEEEYFECLVRMNQARSHDEKNRFYRKMMSVKGVGTVRKLENAAFEYFSRWYIPVVRELLLFGDRKSTPEDVAPLLSPSITPAEARHAVSILLSLELIQKSPEDRWEPVETNLTTGPEIQSLVIANYHREMIRLASESMERFPSEERDITALVLSVRPDRMGEIKQKTAEFRKALLEIATETEDPDQVVQVNIQVFPLTRKK
ncbi:MAG: TIGR02147 family protein [Desulfococcaceae bacterium]